MTKYNHYRLDPEWSKAREIVVDQNASFWERMSAIYAMYKIEVAYE